MFPGKDTATSLEKLRKETNEIVTATASSTTLTKPSSKEENLIYLEKGHEEISAVFNHALLPELKLHHYFLCYGKCASVVSYNTKGAFSHSQLADQTQRKDFYSISEEVHSNQSTSGR